MTFNSGARLDPSRIQRRGRSTVTAGRGGVAAGGGVGAILLLIISAIIGVDLTGLLGGLDQTGPGGSNVAPADPALQQAYEEKCQTGEDANKYTECLIAGAINSLDDYWESAAPALGVNFEYPGVVLFEGATETPCGVASTQTGPFYCPPDATIYIDTTFTSVLSQFGGSTGGLAQLYVIAHEYGHHIQVLLGVFAKADRTQSGPTSDSVKVELMADCLAGVWTHFASTTVDANGTPLLQPFTDQDIQDALSAAASVGDDRIQQTIQGQAFPESFTHGTSDQRVGMFQLGYTTGSAAQCDQFGVISKSSGGN